jgi:hypothetical protein
MMYHLFLATALCFPAFRRAAAPSAKCLALKNGLQLEDTTILDVRRCTSERLDSRVVPIVSSSHGHTLVPCLLRHQYNVHVVRACGGVAARSLVLMASSRQFVSQSTPDWSND